jgi:DUF971 family protein
MNDKQLRPASITADRTARRLSITWGDGHVSDYSFTFLRRACPCASCRGGHEAMGVLPSPELYDMPDEDTPATRLTNLEPVGAYAITPEWEDGHHYGIYNWGYLRNICPCPICRGKEAAQDG